MSNWSRKGLYWKEMGVWGTDQKWEDQRNGKRKLYRCRGFVFISKAGSVGPLPWQCPGLGVTAAVSISAKLTVCVCVCV